MKKELLKKVFRASGIVLASLLLLNLGAVLGLIVSNAMTAVATASNNSALSFAGQYLSFIGIWIVIVGYCLVTKKNRPLLGKLGRDGEGNNLRTALAVGLPCGIGLNLIVAFAAMLHGDITLSFAEFNPLMILLFIVCIAVQSGAEELVDRFFLYQKIKELFPNAPATPILINAVVFSAIHIFNPGVTVLALVNIVLVGVLYSLIIYYFDSFWAAVVAHASWNFCQNILLGLPNSGIVSAYSVFKLDAAAINNSFAYNVNFGIEGTILSSVLLLLACMVVVAIGRMKKNGEDPAKMIKTALLGKSRTKLA